jgi:hypothetical protein
MGIFGWSYPPGCSGPPEYLWSSDGNQCTCCGEELPSAPDAFDEELWEETDLAETIQGIPSHAFNIREVESPIKNTVWYQFSTLNSDLIPTWKCRSCGELTHGSALS